MKVLTDAQVKDFNRDGFIIVRGNFNSEEISLLARASHEDKALDQAATSRDDGKDKPVRLTAWNHPGTGIYGMFARCRRVVDAVEQLLEDEVYHYHSKMILKDARTGGAWAWHQDYGYWYQNGCLYPDFISVSTAVDRATRQNGCMQVLVGSHKLGRVNHILSGEQAGADMERVNEAKKRLALVHCEMEPGDSLYFHANLLHCSAANDSDHPRWSLISCYNTKHNDPFKDSHHPRYTPLQKVDDSEVLRVARERFTGNRDGGVHFDDFNSNDTSAKSLTSQQP